MKLIVEAEGKINMKESFQFFLLIDSIYRKDKNYYPNVFLEK